VGDIPDNADLDHIQDLQLGGLDDILNVGPLDSSVNRSLGAQINHRISDLEIGTPIGRVTMGER
jgi:filamentous hemagglutinin